MIKNILYILIFTISIIFIFLLLITTNKNINIKEKFSNTYSPFKITSDNIIRNYIDNNYTEEYIQFNSSSDFVLNEKINCDILVVGGGGGGGFSLGGGGGGGGVVYIQNYVLLPGKYSIIIGNGGDGMQFNRDNTTPNGGNSIIRYNNNDIITALGGGRGNGQSAAYDRAAANNTGGSGSGGIRWRPIGSASIQKTDMSISENSRKYGFGNNGGNAVGNDSYPFGAGGGGGAGGVGKNASSIKGGDGGEGKLINITGTNVYYAGGGGGSIWKQPNVIGPGLGGLGGGGAGGMTGINPKSGIDNTGGGGGGHDDFGKPGKGGSGVVIIRYKIPEAESVKMNNLLFMKNHIYEDINYEIIKYPSTNINSFSGVTKISDNEYAQTFNINNLIYKINFSYYNSNLLINSPHVLFDGNTNYIDMNKLVKNYKIILNNYNKDDGSYIGSTIYNKNGIQNENGEWINITFPESFILKNYGFIAIRSLENCAPGIWKLYARNNDNEKFTLIDENILRLTHSDYRNNESLYIKRLNNNTLYNSYLFIFKRLASSDINNNFGGKLNFTQILLFGKPE
jgi:hypothetical protein